MLATQETPKDLSVWDKHYPMLMSPKLDGIRATVIAGTVYSRTLKPIRSDFVQKTFGRPEYNGLDGELICGNPTDPNVYQKTYSAVMTHGCTDPVSYYLFDDITNHREPYQQRLLELCRRWLELPGRTTTFVLPQMEVVNLDEVLAKEADIISAGYEGCILRRPDRPYKFNRATLNEGSLLKLKRFEEGEAYILDFEERMHNANEAVLDARGYTKRSSHKGNLVGLGTLGAIWVRDVKDGSVFKIGVFKGLDDADKKEIWENKEKYRWRICKYKRLAVGRVDLPRHPSFYEWGGFRDPDDMDLKLIAEGTGNENSQE
jgi:DNA ligase-1